MKGFMIVSLFFILVSLKTTISSSENMKMCHINDSGCSGQCSIRNYKCGEIMLGDVLQFGCLYCNYDVVSGKCLGICHMKGSFNSANVCLSLISVPNSDADCVFASCETSQEVYGNKVYSGTCIKSGLSCKVGSIPAYTKTGFSEKCFCQ